MTLVLDASVVAALMRRDVAALGHLRAFRPGDLLLCPAVAAEIQAGLERLLKSRRRTLLEAEYARLRAILPWSDWTEPAALEFGRLKARSERMGAPLRDMDLVVASVALTVGGGVATTHATEFRQIVGLHVEEWAS